jgi:lysophospholipase L1-like esterase
VLSDPVEFSFQAFDPLAVSDHLHFNLAGYRAMGNAVPL